MKMKIINHPQQCPPMAIAATIGMFDGFHLGHRTLVESLKREAGKRGLATAVVTFRDHPQNVLHHAGQKWICTLDDRIQCIADQGVDYLILMDFTPELAALDSTAFMLLLRDRYHLRALVVGFNHRFGHNRSEGFDDYRANGARLGVEVVQAAEYAGEYAPVSSSIVRRYIAEGNVEAAMHRLYHPFCLSGTVVHGLKNGRKIGFPTANVGGYSPQVIMPANGVYVTLAQIDGGDWLPSMANIGTRPTVLTEGAISVEVNIFNFDADIYDHRFAVRFIKRLRNEVHHASLDALKRQLAADRDASLRYFSDRNINHTI
ncbi:MAG: riboflavin biosynthesis protein RibF [Muribaculaceae bacterium]